MSKDKIIPTLIDKFYHWESQTPNSIFLRQPKGSEWYELTYKEAGNEARRMVTALNSLGLKKGDHIGIYSKNCYHWILADIALMIGGFVSVPLYASLPTDQLSEVISLSDLKAIFLGKLDTWGDKSKAIPPEVVPIKFPHYKGNDTVNIGHKWNDLIAQSKPMIENHHPALDELWTILFTSGTTGTPKGVMHIHGTPAKIMINEIETNWIGIGKLGPFNTFSYLPLNHVAERIGLELTAIWMGGSMSFGESLDSFVQNLRDVQPDLFFSVPRIWMKFYLGVSAKIPPSVLSVLLRIPLLGSMVKKKMLSSLGMSNVKIAATGAAITPAFIKKWYKNLGIHLMEAYGMTEVCGSFTNGVDLDTPLDSVGRVIPKAEIKIDDQTGELFLKSPYMMTGYYNDPDTTNEVLKEGWLASGDRGKIDKKGYVRIVGRVKDAFKTSKGIYVIPNPMEEKLMQNDYIEQVCIVGLGVPQPIAIVNISEIGKKCSKSELISSLENSLYELKKGAANYQIVSTIVVDVKPWTLENNFLTPTLKVKRNQINLAYQDMYLTWHNSKDKIVWTK